MPPTRSEAAVAAAPATTHSGRVKQVSAAALSSGLCPIPPALPYVEPHTSTLLPSQLPTRIAKLNKPAVPVLVANRPVATELMREVSGTSRLGKEELLTRTQLLGQTVASGTPTVSACSYSHLLTNAYHTFPLRFRFQAGLRSHGKPNSAVAPLLDLSTQASIPHSPLPHLSPLSHSLAIPTPRRPPVLHHPLPMVSTPPRLCHSCCHSC